ncbi:MAG: hypothetical protein Q7W55_16010 [Pseudohongiella sp.]|nr:hypothetical protein [Pseudohongiella sp.]MDP2126050.1 hypothetical protein [Pseudohongiella sp.]
MREFLKRVKSVAVCCAVCVFNSAVVIPVYAQNQRPVFLDLDIAATFEYPSEITDGDTFPVYVRIHNNSDQTIEAPFPSAVLMRSDADLIYMSDFCRMHCLFARSRMIAPGGSVLLHMGDVYTNIPGLTEGQVGYGDARIAGVTADGELYAIDVEDILPIIIKPSGVSPGPGSPAPRLPLELQEDQKVVHDPNTGYDWLRFDNTAGITFGQLQSRLQPGGDLHGFSIASRHQVQTLIQNQLLAADVAMPRTGLSGFGFGIDGLTALQELTDLLQPTGETDRKFFVNGVVSDPIPLTDNQPRFVTLTLYGDKTLDTVWFSSPFGLHTMVVDETTLAADSAETGVWLVRGAEMNRHKSSGKATYANDYLFLPNVLIDGNHYRLEMYRKEGTILSFVVTDIQAATAADLTQPAAEFDPVTGLLSVGNVEVFSDFPVGQYDLKLEIVPETDLPLARLVDVSLSAE